MENKDVYIKISKDYLKELSPLKIKEQVEIYNMYDIVFKDIVESYIEVWEEDNNIKLQDEDISYIANKVGDNDYLWETIHEIINVYLQDYEEEEE